MAEQTQTLKSHRRFHPMWHFVAVPLLVANVVINISHAVRQTTQWNVWGVVAAIAILVAVFAARIQTVTVQNRLIRLEMRLYLSDTLPSAMHGRIAELSMSQLIGLRFASDSELPALVERCLSGELKDNEAVKKEIRTWKADFVRA